MDVRIYLELLLAMCKFKPLVGEKCNWLSGVSSPLIVIHIDIIDRVIAYYGFHKKVQRGDRWNVK